ncbi:DUF1007 family protein [Oceaniglobus ichthyenteri]|uniref:DUF1007 family protein n=1 Tax=Oceaniglobus ichthyenteri TaxID=2136177 RepID=UPI000D37367F|nr:DUF1007 family protein [Oceaniglobus ichthyenteri]
MKTFGLASFISVVLAFPALAHPHLFLDTGLNPVFNADGQLAGVRVIWVYDEFYSLVLVEENGFDQDGDMRLTEQEGAALAGFDQRPEEGFTGTTTLYLGDRLLDLSEPFQPRVTMEAGRIISTHLRLLETPLDIGEVPVFLRTFDPTYYAAFDLSLKPRIEGGAACTVAVVPPDTDAAQNTVESLMAKPDAGYDEDNYPEVGEIFATTLRLTCP